MIQELLNFFDQLISHVNLESIKNTILLLSFVISAILIYHHLQIKKISEEFIKLAGCFIVVALSILADNEWVYAIAIFITATLITSIEYLENLAAIITQNENFWTYRQKQKELSRIPVASETEIEEKRDDDISIAPVQKGTRENQEDIRITAREFEERVLLEIEKLGVFDRDSFYKERRIDIEGRNYIFDALGVRLGQHRFSYYIIEVKYFQVHKSVLKRGIDQLLLFSYAFEKYVRDSSIPVYGLLVIPSNIDSQDFFEDKIGILKYDVNNHTFINTGIILDWIKKNDWKN